MRKKILTVSFLVLLLASAAMVVHGYLSWSDNFAFPDLIWPPFSIILQNLKPILHGSGGYFRTLWGFLAAAAMAVFFLTSGRLLTQGLRKWSGPWAAGASGGESAVVHYLLGALISSMIWLVLGAVGAVGPFLAFFLLVAGFVLLALDQELLRSIARWPREFASRFTLVEISILVLIAAYFAVLSALSVRPSDFGGDVVIHMPLAHLFASNHGVFTYPFHIHSYNSLNAEMLILWSFLLKSEVATKVIMWGFAAALSALLYQEISKKSTKFTGLCSAFLFLTSSVYIQTTLQTVKNDLLSAVFLAAHYFLLAEMFDQDGKVDSDGRWNSLLAGILVGGAVGAKWTALPAAVISLAAICIYDLANIRAQKYSWRQARVWPALAGFAAASSPWFLRDAIATGNPVYPFVNSLFGGDWVEPWHSAAAAAFRHDYTFAEYFRELYTLLGPFSVFGALSIFLILDSGARRGWRWASACALLSVAWLSAIYRSPRYQLGLLIFLIAVSFSHGLSQILNENSADKHSGVFKKAVTGMVLAALLCSSALDFRRNYLAGKLSAAFGIILPGYEIGQYIWEDDQAGTTVGDLSFVQYLINTRTEPGEGVLYVNLSQRFAFGLERPAFYSSDVDKQILQHLAEQSKDAADLWDKLLAFQGTRIRHVVAAPLPTREQWFDTVYAYHEARDRKLLDISEKDYEKIRELFAKYMKLRVITPDGKLSWYSLKVQGDPQLSFTQEDAARFPVMMLHYAAMAQDGGDLLNAEKLYYNVVKSEPIPDTKRIALHNLAYIFISLGENLRAKNALVKALEIDPIEPRANLYMGIALYRLGEQEQAQKYLAIAWRRGDKEEIRSVLRQQLGMEYHEPGAQNRRKG